MSRILATLLVGVALAATPAAAARRDSPDAQLHRLLEGRVAGPPIRCISLANAGSSTIIPGRAIVYRVGSRLYVNLPRSGASSLDDDDILVTRTFGNRLCSRDPVNLVSRAGRMPRGFVLLGDFVPYEKVKSRR
jgi:hypothetical protein